MKILLIEDEKELAGSITEYLQKENYLCEAVLNYDDAIEKINLYQYDCIIVDITLPDGSGLDVIRALKHLKSETGIIIISARNSLVSSISAAVCFEAGEGGVFLPDLADGFIFTYFETQP